MLDTIIDRRAPNYGLLNRTKQYMQTPQERSTDFKRFASGVSGTQGQPNATTLRKLTKAATLKAGFQTSVEVQSLLTERLIEPNDTGKAIANFQALVREIPDVLAIRVRGGQTSQEKRFVVVVPSLFSDAARSVYELQGNLFRKFPAASLDVRVEGVREGGKIA